MVAGHVTATINGSRANVVISCFEGVLRSVRCLHNQLSESGEGIGMDWHAFESLESHSPRPTGGIYVNAGGVRNDSDSSAAFCFKTPWSEATGRGFKAIEMEIAKIAHLNVGTVAMITLPKRKARIPRLSRP